MFDGWLRELRLDAEADDPLQGRDDGRVGAAAGRHGLPVPDRADGLHPERRHRPAERPDRGDRRASATRRWSAHQKADDGHPARPTRTSRSFTVERRRHGRRAAERRPEAARTSGTQTADQIIEELRPKLARMPGVRVVPVEPAGDPHRRHACRARSISSRCRIRTPRSSIASRRGSRRRCANVPGLPDVNSDLQIRNPQLTVDLDREQIAALGLTVDQVRVGAVVGLRLAAGLADLRARRRVPGDHAGRAGVPAGSGGAVDALRAGAGRQARAAVGGRHDPPERRARSRSTTSASCRRSRCRSTSRPASRSATPWRASQQLARETLPGTVSGSFQGTAQAFQDSMRGLGWVLVARDLRDLRRARHPLRELHPPAHDSLGPAVGRLRRAADAADLQAGPQHLRVRRRHHARRPGQEERHHDDRLRDRGAARARASAPPTRSTKPAWSASGRS